MWKLVFSVIFSLKLYFQNYFSSVEAEIFYWKRNPFDAYLIAVTLTTTEQKQFTDVFWHLFEDNIPDNASPKILD